MCKSSLLEANKPEGGCEKAAVVERLEETIRQKDLQLSDKDAQIKDLLAKCRRLTNEVMLAKLGKELLRQQIRTRNAGQPTSEAPKKPAPKPGFFNAKAPPTAPMAASMRESVLAALGVMNDPNIGNTPGSLFGCKKAAANVNTAKGPVSAASMASMFSTCPSTAAGKTGPTMFQPSFMRPASGMESAKEVNVPAPQAAPPPPVPDIPAVAPMPYRSRSGGVYCSSRPVADVQTRFDFKTLCVNLPGDKAPVAPGTGNANDTTADNRAANMAHIAKTSAPAPPAPARQSSVTNKITPPAAAAVRTHQPAVTKASAAAASAPSPRQPTVTKASAVKSSSSSHSSRIPKPAVSSCTKVKSSVAPTTRAAPTRVKSSVAPTTRAEPTNVKSAAVSKGPAVTKGVVRSQSAADGHIQRLAASRRMRA
eukprot:jgi/Chrzof1/10846/Cz05g14100.t1